MNCITIKLTNNSIYALTDNELLQQCNITKDDATEDIITQLKNYLLASQQLFENKYNVVFGENEFQSTFTLKNSPGVYIEKCPVTEITTSNVDAIKNDTITYIKLGNYSGDFTVNFKAGWKTADDIPNNVKQSLLMLVSYYYNNRDAQQDKQLYSPAFAIESLMSNYLTQIY